jgi:hypothetical protein
MLTIAAWCFSVHDFEAATPSCFFACRSSSGRAFHSVIRELVLLPRNTLRTLWVETSSISREGKIPWKTGQDRDLDQALQPENSPFAES